MSFHVVFVEFTQNLHEFIVIITQILSARASTIILYMLVSAFILENPVKFSSDFCCSSFKFQISELVLVAV